MHCGSLLNFSHKLCSIWKTFIVYLHSPAVRENDSFPFKTHL